jgi:hypothetical protein
MRLSANYGGCLTVGSDAAGLYLAVMFLFRVGHPPLFIPWDERTISRKRDLLSFALGDCVRLKLGRQE